MNNPGKPLHEWFGYDRRERRATIVLIVIGLLLFSFRYIVPEPVDVPLLTLLDVDTIMKKPDSDIPQTVRNEPVKLQNRQAKLSIELNQCDSAELVKLPGIGPVLSGRIIKFRKLLGGFADKKQLLEVYGLPEDTYNTISSMVTADTSLVQKIKINSCEYRELVRHPYLTPDDAKSLMHYRDQMGRIENWNTILKNNLLTGEKGYLVRYYVVFE